MSRRVSLRSHAFLAPVVVACLLVVSAASYRWLARAAGADEPPAASPNAERQRRLDGLPVRRVVLFSSGVGYFEHEGTVDGNVDVVLQFRADDVNDLLKSLVVQDLDGGQITAVSYTSRDPITRTLRSFAIDLTENPSLYELLEQLRGEPVAVYAPEQVRGTVLSVEQKRRVVAGTKVVETQEYLNLLTESGVRSVRLDQIQRLEVLNDRIAGELVQALEVLASAHDTQKKTVVLRCRGQGKRRVRVGYVREVPVWKTTYRLALEGDTALLQGWAIVENTTDSDWARVRMALVSGRPVSFRMDLYQPLYVERPSMELAYDVPVRPRMYEGELEQKAADRALAKAARRGRAAFGGFGGGMPRNQAARPAPAGAPVPEFAEKLAASAAVAAVGEQVGAQFQYVIQHAVDLPRQRSALLPIVSAQLAVERLSIYNRQSHAKFPMRGLRFKNDTGAYLMRGPIAVFDQGVYAGDALLDNTPKGHRRLISYALDLDVEVAVTAATSPAAAVSYRIVRGSFIRQSKLVRSTTYKIRNRGQTPRLLLLEHPAAVNWQLLEPAEPEERTRSLYRFRIELAPERTVDFVVREAQPRSETIALRNLRLQQIELLIQGPAVPATVKDALGRLLEMQRRLATINAKIKSLQQRLQEIAQDQDRIRKNLGQIDAASTLAKRYLEKLQQQETEIERLQAELKQARATQQQAQQELDDYLSGLTIE